MTMTNKETRAFVEGIKRDKEIRAEIAAIPNDAIRLAAQALDNAHITLGITKTQKQNGWREVSEEELKYLRCARMQAEGMLWAMADRYDFGSVNADNLIQKIKTL